LLVRPDGATGAWIVAGAGRRGTPSASIPGFLFSEAREKRDGASRGIVLTWSEHNITFGNAPIAGEVTVMRILATFFVIAAALTFPMTGNAANAQGKAVKGQDVGSIRDKCRAEAYGFGMNKSAQIRACVQRAKGR